MLEMNLSQSIDEKIENKSMTNRILSGIQPTGNLHLGNYLGAVRNWGKLQDQYEGFYCIVNLHAMTVFQKPEELRRSTLETAACIIASGVDPVKNSLFIQSHVPSHTQLAWIFNCVARLGWLNRMTQFKEKAGKHKERASVGLYSYPVLMAADILVYKATHVPVGDDQKQHLELARDICQKFNHDYGVDFFPELEPVIQGPATRVMSLRDGSKKMSKSDVSEMSRIHLTDDADTIATKIRKAKTDPDPLPESVEGLENRPEAKNLIGIYAALQNQSVSDVCSEQGGKLFSEFKGLLADCIIEHICPIGNEMQKLLDDPQELNKHLKAGAENARQTAESVVKDVYDIVGLVPS